MIPWSTPTRREGSSCSSSGSFTSTDAPKKAATPMSDATTSYIQQSGKTNQEPKSQSCVESQCHVSGNAAIIASNQNHQCFITPCGAELKCGCRVVVMGNLCLENCGNLPMLEGYVRKHHVAILCDADCSGTIVNESLVEPSEFSEDKHTLMMINRSLTPCDYST